LEAGSLGPQARENGPYLSVAAACERVLQEQDGVLSIIRVIDRIITGAIGTETPDQMPPVPINFTLLVVLKSGGARGRYSIRITLEAPSGVLMPNEVSLPVLFEGEERGTNFVIPVGFQAEQEGLYWFAVWLEDPHAPDKREVLTRVPLRVMYQPQRYQAGSNE
jgi:hypothetical protein